MKKIICLTSAFLIASLTMNAQQYFNDAGEPIDKPMPAKVVAIQTAVDYSHLDATGMPKNNNAQLPSAVEVKLVPPDPTLDATGMKIGSTQVPIINNAVVTPQSNDNLNYRAGGDIPGETKNGVKETYTRKSNENTPVDYSNGVKETYVRDLSVKEPKMAEQAKIVIDPNAVNGSSQQSKPAQTTGSAPNANATKTAPVNPAGPVLIKQSDDASNTKDVEATPPVNPSK
jgi:hypothetical protein